MAGVNELDDDATFGLANGFRVAAALTSYSDSEPIFDDPTIGEVIFNHYKWGQNPDGSLFADRFKIPTHYCTRQELGLEIDEN